MRWQHPTRGLVPPSEFVPLAEQTGYIRTITQWVLGRAIAQCAEWRNRGLPMNVSVNISSRDLIDSELARRLKEMLERESCAAQWLTLEVTESAIVGEPGHALKNLERLHELGCKLAVDDYGTGYSSLAYLRRLPLDELKIDKSFIMGMAQRRERRADRPLDDRARAQARPDGRRERRRGRGDAREAARARLRQRAGLPAVASAGGRGRSRRG